MGFADFSNSAAPIYYNAVFCSAVFQLWKSMFWELIANISSTLLDSMVCADGIVYRASEALLGLGATQNQPCSSLGARCPSGTGASVPLASVISGLAGTFGKRAPVPTLRVRCLTRQCRPGVGSLLLSPSLGLLGPTTSSLCTYAFLIFIPSSHLCHREIMWGLCNKQ